MAWNVTAKVVKMLVVPRPSSDEAEDLLELQHALEAAFAAMPDATILDIHIREQGEGFSALVFYTEAERPARGMGFR